MLLHWAHNIMVHHGISWHIMAYHGYIMVYHGYIMAYHSWNTQRRRPAHLKVDRKQRKGQGSNMSFEVTFCWPNFLLLDPTSLRIHYLPRHHRLGTQPGGHGRSKLWHCISPVYLRFHSYFPESREAECSHTQITSTCSSKISGRGQQKPRSHNEQSLRRAASDTCPTCAAGGGLWKTVHYAFCTPEWHGILG